MTGNPPKPERGDDSDPYNITGKYILKYRKPVPCPDLYKWGRWLQRSRKHVRSTYIGNYWVSTVFLGIDHSYSLEAKVPVLFETMVFKNDDDGGDKCERTTTWRKALKQHWDMVEKVKHEL